MRKQVKGIEGSRPRLSVFRSACHIYAQIIVDTTGQTLVQVSSLSPEFKGPGSGRKLELSKRWGLWWLRKPWKRGLKRWFLIETVFYIMAGSRPFLRPPGKPD